MVRILSRIQSSINTEQVIFFEKFCEEFRCQDQATGVREVFNQLILAKKIITQLQDGIKEKDTEIKRRENISVTEWSVTALCIN